MTRILPFTLAVLFSADLAQSACAHELKVLASQLAVAGNSGKSTIYLSWGHRLPIDDLVDATTIERYDLLNPKGQAKTLTKAELSLQTNVVELTEAGIHQVVVNKKASIYTYVFDTEGVRQLKRGPKTANTESKIDTASRYQQCAKALIVVGKPAQDAPKAIGQTLEIVPLDGPAKWTGNSMLRFKVLLEGKPASAAEITATYVGFRPNGDWCYATTSNKNGEFSVRPSQAGTWVIKTHIQRLTQGKVREQYDFESYTATLSFEVQP